MVKGRRAFTETPGFPIVTKGDNRAQALFIPVITERVLGTEPIHVPGRIPYGLLLG